MILILCLLWLIIPFIYLNDDKKELNKYGFVDYLDNFWPQFRIAMVFMFVMVVYQLPGIDLIKTISFGFYLSFSAWLIKDVGMAIYLDKPYYYLGHTSGIDLLQRKTGLPLRVIFYIKAIILLVSIIILAL